MPFARIPFRYSARLVVSAGVFLAFSSLVAAAQQAPAAPQATAPEAAPAAQDAPASVNPLRAVTNFIGLTAEVGPRPDFVEQTHPDKMDYSPLVGPEKKRIAVKTPAQVTADTADLIAVRDKATARLKKLSGEKAARIAPGPKPPAQQDQF